MSTTPKKDPLNSLFGQTGSVSDPSSIDMPEPHHVSAPRPTSRPMPPPVLPPSPMAGPDPRQLAKMLAKAAAEKAGPATPVRRAAPEEKPKADTKPVVRGVAAAPPPMRKLSALEALELARKSESEAPAEKPPAKAAEKQGPPPAAPSFAPPRSTLAPEPVAKPTLGQPTTSSAPVTDDQLGDIVQSVLGTALPGAQIYIANAMFADDRPTLTALWRSHRARFLATHQIEYAVGAAVLLHFLKTAPQRSLAAAHGVTDKGEFLLWVDLDGRVLVTAFANPRQLVAGW